MRNVYKALLKHLGTNYIGVVDCPEMDKILRICLSEEEAEILLYVGHIPAMHGVRHISGKSQLPLEKAQKLLEGIVGKGFIGKKVIFGKPLYGVLPIIPGIYESTFIKPDRYKEKVDELRALWKEYKKKYLIHEMGSHPTPPFRVVPVDISVPADQYVFNRKEVSKIIEKAGLIVITNCACRELNHACDKPIKDICMTFDLVGDILLQGGLGKKVDVKQAKDVLETAEKAGLVHLAMNCSQSVQILCNCCGCCCVSLQGLVHYGTKHSLTVSGGKASIDQIRCSGCEICKKICWTKAIVGDDKKLFVDDNLCIGCGICVPKCKKQAITMVENARVERRIPFHFTTLTYRMAREREKTAEVVKALMREML